MNLTQPKNLDLFEHIIDVKVPCEFKGKRVSVQVIISAESGDWKSDWFFEGISFTVNAQVMNKNFAVRADSIKKTFVDKEKQTVKSEAKPQQKTKMEKTLEKFQTGECYLF